ncbi:methylmalonyl-CoA mutase subunit beta [Salegentibacter salegens]|uniref:Heterodimeric methylmalonyl-CoA mutase small subunit n=1 Tax=Salegentibacter salegens TaxID=143223 RepID=A0A1M7HJZ2_9FLAO|nr:methylmalonyl-CoA mutase subunit beta [Salegentibacter salegens]PRX41384.1 methylmalonyl-CoA mutase [Salegentibacter salegens]SHM28759.1 heterodimeric methylmalonyl-CoA mutase small subunit [Salegentibacter salegens]
MKESLFQEFEEVSAKQWKQKIQFDLKGADYNEKLVYKSLDGINIKPFYSAEDVEESIKTPSPKNWNICERLYVASAEKTNRRAQEVLNKGTESLWFIIPNEEVSIEKLLKSIELEKTIIYFSFNFFSEDYFKRFREFFNEKKHQIFLQFDIVGNLARSGNWFQNLEKDHQILDGIFDNSEAFKSVISIDTTLYQNAGANIPQQLAYALSHVNEYLNHFQENSNFKEFQPQFLIASGPNYFFEIAKIKALRWLYATLASEYSVPETCHILAQPTKRNKTLYDFNVNLLRTTTESMSAVLGGANTVYNMPYDAIYHKNNEFGDRIARNQLLVMKHEAYLDKVANAAEGAYYIESLTKQFADMALDIFKEIEKGGGFLKQLKEGVIQRKIKESAKKEQEQFDSGELVLIGTNKFENPQDKMKDELELYPFLKQNPRKTLIEPILERRLSEQVEQERLKQEKAD